MTQSSIPKPPPHLGTAGRRLWRRVMTEYELASWQLDILETAAVAADRLEEARKRLAAEGLTVEHPRTGVRPHPCISIESSSRTAMLRALRELALSADDVAEAPRPPLIAGRYRLTGA